MKVQVLLRDGPLPPAEPWYASRAGAVVCFEGVVRPEEDRRPLLALDYQQYPPMTQRQLTRLAEDMTYTFGLLAIRIEHSVGRVPAGQVSFRLRVASAHRAEALQAMGRFIDRMKRDVPLWKLPVWAEQDEPAAQSAKEASP